jgi:hypothetical protein
MTGDAITPATELAAFTRSVVDMHEDWDGMHQFMVLVSDEGTITPRVIGVIDPALHPDLYPKFIAKLAWEDVQGMKDGDLSPVAYLLQIEAYGVTMPPPGNMTPEEEAELSRARRDRTFHQRPDAQETCMALCADVRGRIYQVTKFRADGRIEEEQIAPGDYTVGGQMAQALRAVAHATGVLCWSLPGSPQMAN